MSIREAMEKAADHLESAEPTDIPEPVASVETSEPAPVEAAPTRTAAERARDEAGRFAKAAEKAAAERKPAAAPKGDANGAAAVAPPAGQDKVDGAASPTAPSTKSDPPPKIPQSWKPGVRELAAKLPAEFRPLLEEAHRREVETARVLSETAEARKTVEAVRSTLQPYETIARANGMDAMQYAGSVLQSAAVLQMGSPQQKAALIAGLIQQYGIDPDSVNPYLTGQAQPPRQPAPQQQRPAFDPRSEVRAVLEEERNRQAIEEFLGGQPEFLDDVMADMTLLLRADRAKGGNMTPQAAYDRACRMNEDVANILAERKAATAVRTPQRVTEQARAAASSVRSQPAAPPSAQPKGIRGALEAAAEKLGI